VVGHQELALGVLMGLFAQNAENSGKNDAEITLISALELSKLLADTERQIENMGKFSMIGV